jgi:hypothetical protein
MEKREHLHTIGENVNWYSCEKQFKKLKAQTPYHLAI